MEKYYKPTIDEFHVGFEYERCDDGYSYFKDIYPKAVDQNKLEAYLPYFRVKYLDKEDIEELGWAYDVNESGEESPNLISEHGYSSAFAIDKQLTELETCYLLYHFPDGFLIIDSIFKCGSGRENMLFRGFIKNKSELKKLMNQLNITKQ
jgi:hypothetical protein